MSPLHQAIGEWVTWILLAGLAPIIIGWTIWEEFRKQKEGTHFRRRKPLIKTRSVYGFTHKNLF